MSPVAAAILAFGPDVDAPPRWVFAAAMLPAVLAVPWLILRLRRNR